ncbi:MAG: hypothetical protein UR64_C0026G0005 [Candidatus Nomurabacteria bacterium GW2011_GWE1_35_16]|uniref:Uncharacterized protein n=1 Tax=Candidatus Nomurabacteria bacterium GW2011_GWE1_35_16 TaxID=1618761 RepID=A0A0G0BPE3_9BACT|nr:MAG: hypothetical protein UR64_C0026G0005 [Candidatus Nomurabacteria bacterium GW2011_GWE1_35_16]
MKSKKQKALRTKNRLVLIISLSTLALILIGVLTYQLILNKNDMDILANTKKLLVHSDEPTTPREIFKYTKLSGWTDTSIIPGSAEIQSPDYQPGASTGEVSRGIEILILGGAIGKNQTLETFKADLLKRSNYSDIQETKIDNLPALKYHNDRENPTVHSLEYEVVKGDDFIAVIVRSKDLNTERSYQAEIDAIVNSIRFK